MMKIPQNVIKHFRHASKGQSFVELALVVPILLIILLGLVEVALFMGRYLDVLDLTREAARFASGRVPYLNNGADPRPSNADYNCSTPDQFDFYYDTACIFSPPRLNRCREANDPFCNGFNSFITFNPDTDDVVISVFTIESQTIQANDGRLQMAGGHYRMRIRMRAIVIISNGIARVMLSVLNRIIQTVLCRIS